MTPKFANADTTTLTPFEELTMDTNQALMNLKAARSRLSRQLQAIDSLLLHAPAAAPSATAEEALICAMTLQWTHAGQLMQAVAAADAAAPQRANAPPPADVVDVLVRTVPNHPSAGPGGSSLVTQPPAQEE